MKSAYQRALEKLEEAGIERPREDALSASTKEGMAQARSKAQAKLAELEIMHQKALSGLTDPARRSEEEANFLAERRRIEDARDRRLDELRRE